MDDFAYGWEDVTARLMACAIWAGALLSGLVAVLVRRAIEDRNRRNQAIPASESVSPDSATSNTRDG